MMDKVQKPNSFNTNITPTLLKAQIKLDFLKNGSSYKNLHEQVTLHST
jgi:hypothetical protein